ncbi:hypothetical protein J4573_16330 [Actinomadura barringtoniae]|uniref:Uncharacterized protein n=1 Tax=Actinomadura barringtoniae TaxID=1427535 RepID=A0A939P9Z0_9ACTN|nr:hypothetical protein [Actinomadura barringtoniae]MBO2448670.1 hypothetical protein [Actinomadura barringtoniae]
MDAIDWKDDIPASTPAHHISTEDEATAGRYRYTLRGHAGRWFVVREPVSGALPKQRTKFYPNKQEAREVFEGLVND